MSDGKKQKSGNSGRMVLCSAWEQPDFGTIRKLTGKKKLLILREEKELDRNCKGKRPEYLVPVKSPIASFGTIRMLKEKAEEGYTIVLFPELRTSLDGREGPLPDSVGKLAYILKLPVEALYVKGTYLMSPVWGFRKKKQGIFSAKPEYERASLISGDEIAEWDKTTCIKEVRERFGYDEYSIRDMNRYRKYIESVDGLEQVLYQCPSCKKEHLMGTRGRMLYCLSCKASWRISERGEILPDFDSASGISAEKKEAQIQAFVKMKIHRITDWVEFERKQLLRSVLSGSYQECAEVRVEVCPKGERQFKEYGNGRLSCGLSGFRLELTEGNGRLLIEKRIMALATLNLIYEESRRQLGLELISGDVCYHVFSIEGFCPVKTVLAVEVMYRMWKEGEQRR